jgi:hypothetical protein
MQHAPKRPKLFAFGEGPMGRKGLRIFGGGGGGEAGGKEEKIKFYRTTSILCDN